MSAITFGSVGDIISIALLAKEILDCIDQARGSEAEYRALSNELRSLERSMLEAGLIIERHRNRIGLLAHAIGEEVACCKSCLGRFRALLAKYDRAFGSRPSGGSAKRLCRSAQWRLTEKDAVAKFRVEVLMRCNALSMLLVTANVELSLRLPQQGQGGQNVLKSLQKKVDSNSGLLVSLNTSLGQIYRRLGTMANTLSAAQSLAARAPPLERYSLIQEPFILEDAIGRVSPVHLQFVTSWKAFDAILRVRFEGTPGYRKIKRREFVLQERATGRDVSRQVPWDAAFVSGQKIDMSILFREIVQVKDARPSSTRNIAAHNICPKCQTSPGNEETLDITCRSCGIIYRTVEVDGRTSRSRHQGTQGDPNQHNERCSKSYGRESEAIAGQRRRNSKVNRNSNDLKRYQTTGAGFKRIRIMRELRLQREASALVLQESPMAEAHYVSGRRRVEAEDDNASLIPSFCRGLSHPAADWCYYFPNERTMLQLEEVKHTMLQELCGGIIFAPVCGSFSATTGIIDMGTGTGDWVYDVADAYPDVRVWGFDYWPNQPLWFRQNVTFIPDDVEQCWQLFDVNRDLCYVHTREMTLAIRNWPYFLEQSFQFLMPGGWVELQFVDYHPVNRVPAPDGECDPITHFWSQINLGLEALGVDHDLSRENQLLRLVEEAGFQGAMEQTVALPVGGWSEYARPKKAGQYMLYILFESARDIAYIPLMQGLGWDEDQVDALVLSFREGLKHCRKRQPHFTFRSVYAQKPDPSGSC